MRKIKQWTPLFATQFLGVLNDNLLKNLIVFISVTWVAKDLKDLVIPISAAALVIPFVFFSPLASRLSVYYPKKKVVLWAKFAEMPIMLLSVYGFFSANIYVVFVSLLLMGTQSAIYSPAKYGLIKDVGGIKGVSFGSGSMELLTFLGVLIGTIVSGIVSDLQQYQITFIIVLLIGIAILGWIASIRIKAEDQKMSSQNNASILPFVFTFQAFKDAKKIKGLNFTVLGLACFWLIASLLQMSVLVHLPDVYSFTNTQTSVVIGLIAIGIGLGCFIAGVIAKGRVELGMVPIGGIGMVVCLSIIGFVDLPSNVFVGLITATAFFSGFFKVPLNAWIQERVPSAELPKVLAYNNNVLFLFIILSTGIFTALTAVGDSFHVFQTTAIVTFIITVIIVFRIPSLLLRFVFFITSTLLYKVRVLGYKNIPLDTGGLLICNHISLLDAFVIVASVPRNLRFVMLKEVYENKWLHFWFKRLNMIPVPGKKSPESLEEFNAICREQIKKGHIVCIFPEGELSRNGQLQGFKSGFSHIIKDSGLPVIPMHMEGLGNSMLTYDLNTGKIKMPKLKRKRRPVTVHIGAPLLDNPDATKTRQIVDELHTESIMFNIKTGILKKEEVLRKALQSILAMRKGVGVVSTLTPPLANQLKTALTPELNFQTVDEKNTEQWANICAEPNNKVLLTSRDALLKLIKQGIPKFQHFDKIFVEGTVTSEIWKAFEGQSIAIYQSLVLDQNILSVNTPNLERKDLNGKPIVQVGAKKDSVGRTIPGVSAKVVVEETQKEENPKGKLYVKGIHFQDEEWHPTPFEASIDKDGFITV